MNDVVGISAKDSAGSDVGFMVWGRLFDPVDERELLQVVAEKSSLFDGSPFTDFTVCLSLSEISHHKYFFEGLLSFSRIPIVFGEDYQTRRAEQRRKLAEDGSGLYFLGRP